MVKVFQGTDEEFYMDGYLKSALDVTKKVLRKDWDMVFVVDGTEGAGKSVIAQQMAKYVDPEFTLDQIVFNPKQFKEAIKKLGKYRAVVYDEAYGGLGARGTMSQVNQAIVKMLTEIRYKNLFMAVVLPTYFDLDKYVALWRSRGLVHIYSDGDFKRGYFSFYNKASKKKLYMMGKKMYDYSRPKPVFIGRFTNHYTVDEVAYKEKKKVSTTKDENEVRLLSRKITKEIRETIATNMIESDLNMTKKDMAAVMGVTTMSLHRYLKDRGHTTKEEDAEVAEPANLGY